MATVGDIFEIVSRGSTGGGAMLNVYHLRLLEINGSFGTGFLSPATMEALLTLNYELLIEDQLAWAPTDVRWHGIDVRNLFNVAEVNSADYETDYVGTNVGHYSASFVNPRITSTRKVYGMHGGRKALAPMSEAVTGANGIGGGLITSLGVMVAKWNAPDQVIEPNLDTVVFQIVVVKRIREGAGTPLDPYTYRLPENQGEATYYVADNWKVESLLGSQNSRKVGRGA